MTQFNLVLRILEIITQLFETGTNNCNTSDTRLLIASLVADFEKDQGIYLEEENEAAEVYKLQTILDDVDAKILELRDHFQVNESFHSESKIYVQGLPPLHEPKTIEQVYLMGRILTILNDLSEEGLTSCDLQEAHILLDIILQEFEYELLEDIVVVEDSFSIALPKLESNLNALTIVYTPPVNTNMLKELPL